MKNTNASVKVELLNSNGAPTVYATQPNTVTLRLTNQTPDPIVLQPGTPANPPPTGAFGVVVDFSSFYTSAADAGSLKITTSSSTPSQPIAQWFGTGRFPAWVIVATAEGSWENGEALEFTVSGFGPTVQVGTYFLTVGIYGLGTSPEPFSVPVGVANPPNAQSPYLSQTVTLTLDTATVFVTKNPDEPAVNRFNLTLLNTNPNQALVPAGTTWSDVKFTLSFAYAQKPGYYALTTVDEAGSFEVGIAHDPASGWNPPVKADGPTWVITPQPGNQPILGTGTSAGVTFSIDNVVTQLVPGPTLLYLQYNNIPGYNDGFLTIPLDKEYAVMRVASFMAGSTSLTVDGLTAPTAYLNWEVDNSTLVVLEGVGQVPSKSSAYPLTIEQSRSVVLTAYDAILGTVATGRLVFTLIPPVLNRWLPCGTIMLWQGTVGTIPPGYHLCDGTNGTPDLRDRFVVGARESELPGTSGSSTHTHSLLGFSASPDPTTSSEGAHTHGMPSKWYPRGLNSGGKSSIDTANTLNGAQTQTSGAHVHSVPVNFGPQVTGDITGGVRPRWYALCYIMLVTPP